GSESSIYNSATQSGFILKDYSGQKLLITLNSKDWENSNKKYEGIVFENTGETSVIAGYNCRKATAKLKNGTTFTVWYTTDVSMGNKDYDPQFKTLPGLAVQYEMTSTKMKFKFTLTKVSYESVPSSKFEMPKSGYRIMTYEETKK
ncbi:MAG: GLPGLI family protein, partial [Ginsengibacter sp.]